MLAAAEFPAEIWCQILLDVPDLTIRMLLDYRCLNHILSHAITIQYIVAYADRYVLDTFELFHTSLYSQLPTEEVIIPDMRTVERIQNIARNCIRCGISPYGRLKHVLLHASHETVQELLNFPLVQLLPITPFILLNPEVQTLQIPAILFNVEIADIPDIADDHPNYKLYQHLVLSTVNAEYIAQHLPNNIETSAWGYGTVSETTHYPHFKFIRNHHCSDEGVTIRIRQHLAIKPYTDVYNIREKLIKYRPWLHQALLANKTLVTAAIGPLRSISELARIQHENFIAVADIPTSAYMLILSKTSIVALAAQLVLLVKGKIACHGVGYLEYLYSQNPGYQLKCTTTHTAKEIVVLLKFPNCSFAAVHDIALLSLPYDALIQLKDRGYIPKKLPVLSMCKPKVKWARGRYFVQVLWPALK
jgi:hypothetical protein